MEPTLIQRVDNENYINTVARAMTTSDVRQSGSDYHRLDYSDVLTVANTEHTPLSQRLARKEGARDIKHFWLEQYIAGAGTLTPIAETADPGENSPFVPTRFENTMMKIGRKFIITDEMNVIARAGGLIAVGTDEWGRQMQIQLTMLLRDQELAILKSVLSDSSPRGMRGLLGAYDAGTPHENGWFGVVSDGGVQETGVVDIGAVQITASNVEQYLNDTMLQFYNLNAGPLPNVAYVPPRFLKVIQDAAKEKITIFMSQADLQKRAELNLGGAVGKYYTDFGMIDIVAHPLLTAAKTTDSGTLKGQSRVLWLYEPGLSLIDYFGYAGVHIEPRAKTDPTETRVISEIFSLEVRYLQSHGYWKNFSV